MHLTLSELRKRVSDENDAYILLEELRWGADRSGLSCPHCGHAKAYFLKPKDGAQRVSGPVRKDGSRSVSVRRVWKCAGCRKQFSVLTGTVFHGTKVSLATWLTVMVQMCSAKNGISAREVERMHGVTAETAWFICHRLREAMKRDPLAGMLQGRIAADETYVGGLYGNMHKARRATRPVKPIVLTLIDTESGEARSRVIPNVTGETLKAAVQAQVHRSSTLITDEHHGYVEATRNLEGHETVNHAKGVYGRDGGKVSSNVVEGYFSQFKRSIDGTHHHISAEHLPRYLAEYDFRYNTRKLKDTERLGMLVAGAKGRRLTYKPLKGE